MFSIQWHVTDLALQSGAIFLMSSWYTRSELTKRISWFYSGNALANMFGGLLVRFSRSNTPLNEKAEH